MKELFYLTVIFSMSLFSCKKYEQDKSIQLSTAKNRLAREWIIEAYLENEQDQTVWFNTVKPNYGMMLSKNGDLSANAQGVYNIGNYKVPIEINENGKWELAAQKDNLVLNYTNGGVMLYKILKLSKTDLWCRELNAPEKEYHFKAK